MCRVSSRSIDITKLRATLGRYPTGVAVVTALGRNNQPVGMTINSLISISLDPPLLGWCLDLGAASREDFSRCRSFSVSILARDQAAQARLFARRGAAKFAALTGADTGARSRETGSGLLLPGACAWIQCRVYRRIPLGDHLMLVGQVRHFQHTDAAPLVFSKGAFVQLADENPVAA